MIWVNSPARIYKSLFVYFRQGVHFIARMGVYMMGMILY